MREKTAVQGKSTLPTNKPENMQNRLLESGNAIPRYVAALAKCSKLYKEKNGIAHARQGTDAPLEREAMTAKTIKEALLRLSGIDKSKAHALVMVPLRSAEIKLFTCANRIPAAEIKSFTCTHNIPEKCKMPLFGMSSIRNFLAENGADTLIGLVLDPANACNDGTGIPLKAFAVPIAPARGRIFEGIVHSYGGSFKYRTVNGVEGWAVFESE